MSVPVTLAKFQPEHMEAAHADGSTCPRCPHIAYLMCEACGEMQGSRDRETKLCRPCWRSTRGSWLTALGALAAFELDGMWKPRAGTPPFPACAFSLTLVNYAGGIQALLKDWEREP